MTPSQPPVELPKGGNLVLGPAGEEGLTGLVLGAAWEAGTLECDLCALVCGSDRKVLSDDHFIFWNQPVSKERALFLRAVSEATPGRPDRAQLLVDLTSLPPAAERIVVTLSTVTAGADLSVLQSLRLRALDPASGKELAAYTMGRELTVESCLIVAEVYRHQSNWKLRAVGQGYDQGLAALGKDFGVNIG
jgi:tellurium resistance protein TerD